jgi:distribution and morphology protein 10
MTKDLVACSRYDFNVYSYESELTLGAEYWLRAAAAANKTRHASDEAGGEESTSTSSASSSTTPRDVVSADASRSTASLREARFDASASASTSSSAGAAARRTASLREWAASEEASEERRAAAHLTLRDAASPLPRCDATLVAAAAASASSLTSSSPASASVRAAASSSDGSSKCDAAAAPLLGILKARLSSSGVLALLWEGRLHSTLVSFGLRADVSAAALRHAPNAGGYGGGGYGGGGARKAPLRGIGLDLQYFSTSAEAEGEMERRRSRWSAQGEEHAI